MEDILSGTKELLMLVVAASMSVLTAMFADLFSGVYKAYVRGEMRHSTALRRSVYKFLSYEGAVLVGACIDLLIHFVHLFRLLNLPSLDNVPVVTFLVSVFLCAVELMSIRERAEAKAHARMLRMEDALNELLSSGISRLSDALIDAIIERIEERREKE